jgi:hypothetical protein
MRCSLSAERVVRTGCDGAKRRREAVRRRSARQLLASLGTALVVVCASLHASRSKHRAHARARAWWRWR